MNFERILEEKFKMIQKFKKTKTNGNTAWGFHLILDLKGCSDNINKMDCVREFLVNLVPKLNMKVLAPPVIVEQDDEFGQGVTGIQLIKTSHLAIHGDKNGNLAFIDIFSCKTFDPDIVVAYCKSCFEPKKIKKQFLIRDI